MDKPKHTLLIWSLIVGEGETAGRGDLRPLVFLLPHQAISAEQRGFLRLCAGHYEDGGDEADDINDALDKVSICIAKPDGEWLKYRVKDSTLHLADLNVTDMCLTGSIL